ncbi:MAG: transposase [Ekhidna sp.]|nr:transposase [Ekhidna sp.]
MLLTGIWYDLSDMDIEDMVSENLEAMIFCHVRIEDEVSDHRVLSRFRSELSPKVLLMSC